MRDSDRASNVDENRLTGASSLAAVVSSGTLSAVRYASPEVGVVVDRHEVVVVELSNSSITYRKVHRRAGRCSVDGLASLDSAVMVDQLRRTTRYGSVVCLHFHPVSGSSTLVL